MSTRTWTDDDVHNLMALMLRTLRIEGAKPVSAIPVKEVAEACGFAPTSLLKDCRADRFEHLEYHGQRSMTADQVGKFMNKVARGGDLAVLEAAPRDEMAEARAASSKAASRQRSKKIA